jgi:predicted site-specific integrase-resolvase
MKYVTPTEAAERLFVDPSMIRIYCRKGVFPRAKKLRGTRWIIPIDDIEAVLDGTVSTEGIFKK